MKILTKEEKEYYEDLEQNMDEHIRKFKEQKSKENIEKIKEELNKLEDYISACNRGEVSDLATNIEFNIRKAEVLKEIIKQSPFAK